MPAQEVETPAIDRTQPSGRWEFDGEVAAVFDNMLARSIPQYEAMREATFELGRHYVQPGTAVVDLGCSRGEALAPFIRHFGINNRYIGIVASSPMAAICRERFDTLIRSSVVDIRETDLRRGYPEAPASLTLCILTAQFIPIEHRQRLILSAFRNTVAGGALIIVEKILGATARLDEQLVSRYYDLKRRNGYTQEDIDRKRLSLEGVLVPLTARWNEELLRAAGWGEIDCFWRYYNFAGWIAIRE